MSKREKYTKEECQLLLDELTICKGHIATRSMEIMEETWPAFFKGQKRSAYALFLHTITLAKREKIEYVIDSIPKRHRNRSKEKRPEKIPNMFAKTRLFEQIKGIIQIEMANASKRATGRIMRLMAEVIIKNTELAEEIKRLRPYQEIVNREYSKEIMNGG